MFFLHWEIYLALDAWKLLSTEFAGYFSHFEPSNSNLSWLHVIVDVSLVSQHSSAHTKSMIWFSQRSKYQWMDSPIPINFPIAVAPKIIAPILECTQNRRYIQLYTTIGKYVGIGESIHWWIRTTMNYSKVNELNYFEFTLFSYA